MPNTLVAVPIISYGTNPILATYLQESANSGKSYCKIDIA
jgi:hypothetical protein